MQKNWRMLPMTCMAEGKRYIVVAVARREQAELMALAQPSSESGESRMRPAE